MSSHPSYELFEELGRGANTVVYRAFDLSLGREVAIKELGESARRDPRHRERFLREAQFLAQFEHDNVLRVYSVDTDRGWIVMERMKGTLASKIAAGPSDPDLVRSVLKQTLEALAFLHEKNKVHGTVRPTNLLFNDAGRVKLSEFEQTAVGAELRVPTGSKKYLAPELIRPDFGDFGPPTDLYCLGFTALELLKGPQFDDLFPGTGKGAIDADTAWLRWHSSADELASTKKLVKGIPDDLVQVLDRMLKKRTADRAQTAHEVLEQLADRPLVPVPVADADEEAAPNQPHRELAPAVVRTLAAGQQTALPPGVGAAADAIATPSTAKHIFASKEMRPAKVAASSSRSTAPAFSKDWWNQQLGRPYVLYPLCALILLGALWFVMGRSAGEAVPPIAVTFLVEPDADGVEVVENEQSLTASPDGTYGFAPGPHVVTFRKAGFHPLSQEIEVAADSNKFPIKLEPIVTFVDVAVRVTPPDAELFADGKSQPLADGAITLKHQQDQPLKLDARRAGFVSAQRSLAPDELAKLGNKVSLDLEREPPQLPDSLAAAENADIDPSVNLPKRLRAARLGDDEPMEFVLVTPGTYAFGVADGRRREGELPARKAQIDKPYYIAINEVTNSQYQRFFDAEGQQKAGTRWQAAARKWAEPQVLDPTKNDLPVTNVSHQEAEAFCQWLGGRLPTEIEWEAAVRGPKDRGFPLPWGRDEPSAERCQIFYGELGPVPVGKLTAGASPLGLMNAIGNAAEWCRDSEQSGAYILRGTSFATANIDDVRVTWRRRGEEQGEEDTGFRVVIPVDVGKPISSLPRDDSHAVSGGPPLMTPVFVLYSLPWDSFARQLGSQE